MRNSALQERRNRQILADIVRVYIETGEPVSSRAISKGFEESLSTATIRSVMADLEDAGFLYQPHTSAGRVPTAAAYRFFAQEIASQATISAVDREWIQREMGGATSAAEITERAGHVLAEVSNGLGIIVSPPLGKTVLEHARMWLLPDGRVVVVLISPGGNTRDKILRPNRLVTQGELDATADFLNRHYSGWTLEAIRADLLQKLATERERYEGMAQSALTLCDPAVLGDEAATQVHVEGTAQIIGASEFVDQAQLRDLLAAIEEKHVGGVSGEQAAEAQAVAADTAKADAEMAKLTADLEELRQTLLRRQADFENYRKRVEKERFEDSRRATARVIEGLIPVIDGFEHALVTHREAEYENYRKGFELIHKQLLDSVTKLGVERIDPLGKSFDPHLHQAVDRAETSDHKDGTILQVFQPGYVFHGRVLRPAMVRVAVHPSPASKEAAN